MSLNKKFLPIVKEIKQDIKTDILKEFYTTYLSGNTKYSGIKETSRQLRIAPQRYDTAWFIKTSRRGDTYLRMTSGSYANELNKVGSTIEVFKKKPNLPSTLSRKTIAQLPEKYLDRVHKHIGNHQGFIENAIIYAVNNCKSRHKKEISEVKIWLRS